MTYGDGVSDINIPELIKFHQEQKVLATLTAVKEPGRFGVFSLSQGDNIIHNFREKPSIKSDKSAWINGGYFVLEPEVIDFIAGDEITFEKEPLMAMAEDNKLAAYRHFGFWQSMDTLRDKNVLEDLWNTSQPPWKIWKENN